ncbi:TerD family protein [Psychrobacter sp. H7-1]|uniref:TerD family protein n=1 Tax=Psychrobacter sp. H7-1 TaxID=1569265 RepID=UPI001917A7B1|nr:TerD family protein [Psychrobacter sp. H7-1]
MSQTLIAGANAPLPTDNISVRILSDQPIDFAAYRLAETGKVRGDGDMVFYGQTRSDDGSVSHRGHDTDAFFDISLPTQPQTIQKIALAFSSNQPLSQLGDIQLQVLQGTTVLMTCHVQSANRSEKALILGECYRRQGQWKFRFISQGFDGGLKPLSEHFGVDIADEAPAPSPVATPPAQNRSSQMPPPISAPAPSSPAPRSVNLSKISLTKNQSSINLKKKDDFGKITVNLNWNRQNASGANTAVKKKGFLNDLFAAKSTGIDLDVGAMVHLNNGERTLIQALGGRFGDLQRAPYVLLRGDDRTGQSLDGEWLDINGARWSDIKEVFIFAFIYEGAPNWAQTDGTVTIYVPDQPPIETRMTEGNNASGMCAVARLMNQNGSVNVERINRYFSGHQQMDEAFGWGFNWKRARK